MTTTPTPEADTNPPSPWISPALVYAFGTAVTMWILGFVTHLPGFHTPPQATGILIIATQVMGMVLLGRATSSPLRSGAVAGLITALINLLILGALIAPTSTTGQPDQSPILIIPTYLIASAIIGAVAALAGSTLLPTSTKLRARTSRDWLGRFAVVTVASSVPVLLSGALVTSAQAGLAVRDWPNTYGVTMWLYPLAKMTGGIYYEHAHRLFGSLVGLTALVLLLFAFFAEPRKWTRILLLGIFLLICAQGILGGIRVTSARPIDESSITADAPQQPVALDYAQTTDTGTSRALAMLHGISAQLTVVALCIGAAVTGKRWRRPDAAEPHPDNFLRTCVLLLLPCLLIQLSLGAATRHFEQLHALWTHMGFAAIVSLVAIFAGMRTTMYTAEYKPLKLMGLHVFIFLGLQLLLGFITMMAVLPTYKENAGPEPTAALIIATLHQAIGAALFAVSTVLTLWTFRLTSAKKGRMHQELHAPRSA